MAGVIRVKRSGRWAPARGLYVKQAGGWVPAEKAFIKKDGVWEQIYPTPRAELTIDDSSIILTAYQGYSSTSRRIVMTNSGNDTMTIKSISASTNSNYRVQFNFSSLGGNPVGLTVAPGASKEFDVSIFGLAVTASSTTTINVEYNTGVLGDSIATVDLTGIVNPQYATISVSPSSVSYSTYEGGPLPRQDITISNNGNGGDLTISSITSASGLTSITSVPSSIASGSRATFRITAPAGRSAGTHGDTLYINSNLGTTNIPVIFTVVSTGAVEYGTPGTYSWTVPNGVSTVEVTVVGAGGGGGGSTEVGDGAGGGGGGSGGLITQTISVTPGEAITIVVGAGGAGAPALGRDPNALAQEGPGLSGGLSQITALIGTLTATGGTGGTSGRTTSTNRGPGYGGGGGPGGSPGGYPGLAGTSGTNDSSSTLGGNGALNFVAGSTQGLGGTLSSPTGKNGTRGSGGGGAAAPDRVSPYNWAGGKGGDGYVKLSW